MGDGEREREKGICLFVPLSFELSDVGVRSILQPPVTVRDEQQKQPQQEELEGRSEEERREESREENREE